MERTHRFSRWFVVVALLLLVVGSLCVPSLHAGAPVLNSALAAVGPDRFAVSADGAFVVYVAQKQADGPRELYSMTTGSQNAPLKISGSLPQGFNVEADFQITPDSSKVVYRLTRSRAATSDLLSVPINGGAPFSLVQGLPLFKGFLISPDSSRAVYLAARDAVSTTELFSTPLAAQGAALVKLNGSNSALNAGITPDGARVIYRATPGTTGSPDLYSVPILGPDVAGVKLSSVIPASEGVSAYQLSPDGARVVYLAPEDAAGVNELYSVASSGAGTKVKLNGALGTGDRIRDFQISPNSNRVVYRAFKQADSASKLYSVPITGSSTGPIELINLITEGGDIAPTVKISPDSTRVVYLANQLNPRTIELYSVPIDGPSTAFVQLNNPLVQNGSIYTDFQISPDSSRVVYRATQDTPGIIELYSVPINGSTNGRIKLNRLINRGGNVVDFQISPALLPASPSRVVYRADRQVTGLFALHSTLIDNANSVGQLTPNRIVGGNVQSFTLFRTGTSDRVVYRSTDKTRDGTELLISSLIPSPIGLGDDNFAWKTFMPLAGR